MPWLNKDVWHSAPNCANRNSGKTQVGVQGNKVSPNPYDSTRGSLMSPHQLPNGGWAPDPDVPNLMFHHLFRSGQVNFSSARNRAYGRIYEETRQGTASIGISIAEWEKSAGMVNKRCLQLWRGFKALRKGEFRKFLKTFNMKPKRKDRNRIRNSVSEISSLQLEYSFGWKPAVSDIYAACNVLCQPVPGGPVKGTGSEDYSYAYVPDNGGGEVFSTTAHCKMGANVYVTNPDLYLMQQLGIANPALIAFELIPFSFLGDWAFDIEGFLRSLTDWLGCEVRDAYTTLSAKTTVKAYWVWGFTNPPLVYENAGPCSLVQRRLGLSTPIPNFNLRKNIGTSLSRAANAASLLGQLLTKN